MIGTYHNTNVVTAELLSALVLTIIMFAMLTYREKRKSSLYLFLAIAVEFLFLLGDAASFYNLSIRALPIWLMRITYFVSFTFGTLVLIPFSFYSKSFIEEKVPVRKWTYRIPVLIAFSSFLISAVAIFSGTVYGVVDGKMIQTGGAPAVVGLLQLVAIIYLPIVAFSKKKQIGLKPAMLLGLFGIMPAVLIFVSYDYTGTGGALSLAIVYILLQNDYSSEREKRRIELEQLNNKLSAANEENVAQIEEISALNNQLQENQTRLEESMSEQEAQLEEISALNGQLQENQAQLEEASEEQKAQLEEIQTLLTQKEYLSYSCKMVYSEVYIINLVDNTYTELETDGFTVGEGGDYIAAIDEHIKSGRIVAQEGDVRQFLMPENICNGLSNNKSIEMRYLRTLKDGSKQWCLTTFVACEMDNGHPTAALMLVQNIDNVIKEEELQKSILQKKNEEISKAVEDAKAANKSKSEFLSRMSHDIRTPMNIIVGMTEIAKRHFGDSDKVADCLNKINMESVHLQTLINDVLDISAIESGKLTIRKEEVRVKDIIENMNISMNSLVKTKSIDYVFEQGNLFFPYLNTDNLRISQLYLNLLSNAVKYTPAGGRVKFEIWQTLSGVSGMVELHARISDTGMGMSEEFMKTMYSEFSRAVDTRVNKIQGTGLGLAIVKQIADLMGGTIEVQSELNKGTTFHVILPVEIIEKTDAKKELLDDDFNYDDLKGLNVLIAEDNDLNYEIAYELLSDYGMIISRAEDGSVALDAMDSSEPGYYDLILMDMQMPVMDGLEATREIRKLNREDAKTIPIIAMTANAFAEDALACREAGMDSHVAKPIKVKFLLETILKLRNKT